MRVERQEVGFKAYRVILNIDTAQDDGESKTAFMRAHGALVSSKDFESARIISLVLTQLIDPVVPDAG